MDNERNAFEPGFSYEPPISEAATKQSKLGITSFILSLTAVIFIILTVIFGIMVADQIVNNELVINQTSDFESLDEAALIPLMLTGLFSIAAFGLAFIGLIFGIVGVCFKNRRKTFSMIGIVLNGLIIVGSVGAVIYAIVSGT